MSQQELFGIFVLHIVAQGMVLAIIWLVAHQQTFRDKMPRYLLPWIATILWLALLHTPSKTPDLVTVVYDFAYVWGWQK